ncbi:MAG: PAS domain S-box protein [bacterium]
MMDTLRVLIVEDSADDAALVLRQLQSGRFNTQHRRVDNAADLRKALDQEAWNIIISDHSMPNFDSFGALAVLQEKNLDTPFIIVSGAIGEETVVAAMKAGAHDYVSKNNLARLLPVVERELRAAQERNWKQETENALRSSEERLRTIVQNMPVMMCAFDENGRIIAWNRESEEVTGYNAAEVINNPEAIRLLYPDPEYRRVMKQKMAEAGFTYRGMEWRITSQDGSQKILLVHDLSKEFPIPGWHSWIVGMDITVRKQVEEERERYIVELKEALDQIKTLSGLIPICAECKNIRDDTGYWNQVEAYIEKHSHAEFSHSICPECTKKLYPKYYEKKYGSRNVDDREAEQKKEPAHMP